MTDEQLRQAAALDIRYWCQLNPEQCPNCGRKMADMHPVENLYPHFTGACKLVNQGGKAPK